MLSENNSASLPTWGSSFSGKGSSFGDQARQRNQMATVMLMAIKAANLDTAKRALAVLMNMEKSLQSNLTLGKIQHALQTSNAVAAQELATHFSIESMDSTAH
jgi:hypothetical protein